MQKNAEDAGDLAKDLARDLTQKSKQPNCAYEWNGGEFFENSSAQTAENALPSWRYGKLERYVLMEVAFGDHQYVEVTPSDIIKAVRYHCYLRNGFNDFVGQLTYRDIKQVFGQGVSEGIKTPSIEIRQHCIVFCIPPITALVFHDRCVFQITTEFDTDALLVKLKDLTRAFGAQIDETRNYFQDTFESFRGVARRSSSRLGAASRRCSHLAPSTPGIASTPELLSPDDFHNPRDHHHTGHDRAGGQEQVLERISVHEPDSASHRESLTAAGPEGHPDGRPDEDLSGASQFAADAAVPAPASGGDFPVICRSMLFVATGGAAVVPPTRADSVPTFVQFPLECGVLEILLSTAVGMMAAELEEMDRTVEAFNVACLEHHPKPRTLHDLHELKEPVDGFMDRLANTGKVLEQLLNSSEDMRGMELTRLYYSLLPDEATERDEDDYNPNLEIMFEYFDQELDQMTQRASKVQRVLANAERHINLKLSLMRSKFHIFDIISGILGVGIAAGNGISGIFGMNLRSDLENSKTSFLLSVSAIVLLAATSVLIAWYFRARYV